MKRRQEGKKKREMARTKQTVRTSTGGEVPRPDDFSRSSELERKARAESHARYQRLAGILIEDPSEDEVSELKESLQSILHNEHDVSEDSLRDIVVEMLDDEMMELRKMIDGRTTITSEMQEMVKSAVTKELQRADIKKFIAARVEYEMRQRR
jgi:hypothetical protein